MQDCIHMRRINWQVHDSSFCNKQHQHLAFDLDSKLLPKLPPKPSSHVPLLVHPLLLCCFTPHVFLYRFTLPTIGHMTFHQNMKTTTPENRINAKLRLLALTSASTLNGGLEGKVVRSLATLGGGSLQALVTKHLCTTCVVKCTSTMSKQEVSLGLKSPSN